MVVLRVGASNCANRNTTHMISYSPHLCQFVIVARRETAGVGVQEG